MKRVRVGATIVLLMGLMALPHLGVAFDENSDLVFMGAEGFPVSIGGAPGPFGTDVQFFAAEAPDAGAFNVSLRCYNANQTVTVNTTVDLTTGAADNDLLPMFFLVPPGTLFSCWGRSSPLFDFSGYVALGARGTDGSVLGSNSSRMLGGAIMQSATIRSTGTSGNGSFPLFLQHASGTSISSSGWNSAIFLLDPFSAATSADATVDVYDAGGTLIDTFDSLGGLGVPNLRVHLLGDSVGSSGALITGAVDVTGIVGCCGFNGAVMGMLYMFNIISGEALLSNLAVDNDDVFQLGPGDPRP